MIDFDKARQEALAWLQQTEQIVTLAEAEVKKVDIGEEVWRVYTEVGTATGVQAIRLDIALPAEFPLLLPRVYLAPDSYDQFKYLPHIQGDRFVCTFTDQARPDPKFPGQIIEEVLRRAKRIIEDGLSGANHTDYLDEFNAYWEQEFGSKDQCIQSMLILIDQPIADTFQLIVFDKLLLDKFEFVIHQNEPEAQRLKEYLKTHEIKFNEVEGVYVGDIQLLTQPPFLLRSRESVELIRKVDVNQYHRVVKLLNSRHLPKCLLFSKVINGNTVYFGWLYPLPVKSHRGFRDGAISGYQALTTFQAQVPVTRFSVEDLSPARLTKRTAGIVSTNTHVTYAVAGVGSVGSHLIQVLQTIQSVALKLIDPDVVKIENIGRHLLGFLYVGKNKAEAMKSYLHQRNPVLDISVRQSSVAKVIRNEVEFINSSDFLFIAIGNMTVERWIGSLVNKGDVKVPVFFLWVEPYLAGGHGIFICPGDADFDRYFTPGGSFKFNVIEEQAYVKHADKLSLRETGCQTVYTPYSATDTQLFIAGIFPQLRKIMETPVRKSSAFTWVGNLELVQQMQIETRELYKANRYGQIVEHTV